MAQRNASKKLLCLDIGDITLLWDYGPSSAAIAPHTPHTAEEIEAKLLMGDLFIKFMIGECSTKLEFFEQYAKQMQAKSTLDYATFEKAWDLTFTQYHEIGPLIDSVRYDIRMVLASNCDPLMFKHIRAHPLIKKHFREPANHFFSFKMGVMKPNPQFFNIIFARTGIPAENAILVDDAPENVASFKQLGGTGICWSARKDPVEALKEALAAHGVFHNKK